MDETTSKNEERKLEIKEDKENSISETQQVTEVTEVVEEVAKTENVTDFKPKDIPKAETEGVKVEGNKSYEDLSPEKKVEIENAIVLAHKILSCSGFAVWVDNKGKIDHEIFPKTKSLLELIGIGKYANELINDLWITNITNAKGKETPKKE